MQAGDLQLALERREVHARRRRRRREREQVDGEVRVLGDGHRPRARARGPRAHLRRVPADRRGDRAARGHRASGSRYRSASSSCTAAGSGSTANSGRGSTFVFTLPAGGASNGGERVLIVEDNEKNMKLFRDVLSAKGYATLEATSGEQADRAGHRARARSRADGHPAPRRRRRRSAPAAALGRADLLHPGARAHRPGDAAATVSGSSQPDSTATSPSPSTSPSSSAR